MDGFQALWLLFVLVWTVAALNSKRTIRRQDPSSRIVQAALSVLGFWFILQPWRVPPLDLSIVPPDPVVRFCALLITAAGIALAFWARFAIGSNWSGTVTLKENHQLIRTGPYRLVRHPIYSGILLAVCGTAIGYGRLPCFIGVLVIFLGLWLKSKTEEQLMIQQFGAQYLEYQRQVSALIPGLL